MLHDQNGFLLAGRDAIDAVFVVVNNDGGGIFSLLEYHGADGFEELFGTPHGVQFATLATTHGLGYHPLVRASDLAEVVATVTAAGGIHIVEVRTDREDNAALHHLLADAVADAVGG
jgi:2-succinyl-5-enolpyruvyl-6-hydroxy-3-cyclohexene-1-carboxylate synthase